MGRGLMTLFDTFYEQRIFKTCPKCGAVNFQGHDYGTITDAPIDVQIRDLQIGIEREYLARRCFCPKCGSMWDVVLVDRHKER